MAERSGRLSSSLGSAPSQHVGVIAIFMVYPLVIGRTAGRPPDEISNMLRLGMLALAVAYCCKPCRAARSAAGFSHRRSSPVSISRPRFLAVKLGGLPLVWGMTIFAGLSKSCWRGSGPAAHVHPAGIGRPGCVPGRHDYRACRCASLSYGDGTGRGRGARRHRHGLRARRHDRAQHLEQGPAEALLHSDRHGRRLCRLRPRSAF